MRYPFPAPPGRRWIFIKSFRHWRSGKIIHACNYGKQAFALLVRA
jgi:hypothetical protein